jgi:4-hydroxy-tetrahydrodipicolinate synthase
MKKLGGAFTVTITPFTGDGRRIESGVLRDFVDWQIGQGVAGLIPLGSTGEFLSLTDQERHEVAKTVIDQAKGRIPIVVGTGAECATDVIRYSLDAQELGADAVIVIPPFYSTPTDDELYRHYEMIGNALSIPIMLYNNPATANIDMLPATIARLSGIANVCYVKESTFDPTRIREILRLTAGKMEVFGGIMGYESFLNGAVGWTAVTANAMPRACQDLYRLCVTDPDLPAALQLYERITPLIDLVGQHRYVSATKAVLELMGLPVGPPRSPRLPLAGEDLAWARRVVSGLGLQFP